MEIFFTAIYQMVAPRSYHHNEAASGGPTKQRWLVGAIITPSIAPKLSGTHPGGNAILEGWIAFPNASRPPG